MRGNEIQFIDSLRWIKGIQELTDKNLLILIEMRKDFILASLDIFLPQKLGEVECVDAGTAAHSLKKDSPKLGRGFGKRLSLETEGIFCSVFSHEDSKRAMFYMWGLTTMGEWVILRVWFSRSESPELATKVDIKRADLSTIVSETGTTLRKIYHHLGREIRKSEERLEKRLILFKEMVFQVRHEDLLLDFRFYDSDL